jgi:hypothetical protein
VTEARPYAALTPRPAFLDLVSAEAGCVVSLAEDRETRAARNQSLFREINERVKHVNEGFSMVLPVGEWICECADDTCVERIELSAAAYEAVRNNGTHFLVAPSDQHVLIDVERVTERNDRYWVVEMFGAAGKLADEFDPRGEPRIDGPA